MAWASLPVMGTGWTAETRQRFRWAALVALAAVAGVMLGLLAALDAAEGAADPAREGAALLARGGAALADGDTDAAREAFGAAAALGDTTGDPVLKADGFMGLAMTARDTGNPDAAGRFALEARDLYTAAGRPAQEVAALLAAGDAALDTHPDRPRALEQAMRHFEAAVALADTLDATDVQADALIRHAAALRATDDLAFARRQTERARTLFAGRGDGRGEAHAVRQLARLAFDSGEAAAGETLLIEEARLWRNIGEETELVAALNMLGWLYTSAGRFGEADTVLDEADAIARRRADPFLMAETRRQMAGLAERRGRRTAACEHFAAARDHYRASGDMIFMAETDGALQALDCPEQRADLPRP